MIAWPTGSASPRSASPVHPWRSERPPRRHSSCTMIGRTTFGRSVTLSASGQRLRAPISWPRCTREATRPLLRGPLRSGLTAGRRGCSSAGSGWCAATHRWSAPVSSSSSQTTPAGPPIGTACSRHDPARCPRTTRGTGRPTPCVVHEPMLPTSKSRTNRAMTAKCVDGTRASPA
jgi:hypothetical protein